MKTKLDVLLRSERTKIPVSIKASIVICIAAFICAALLPWLRDRQDAPTPPATLISVTVVTPQRGKIAEVVSATGVTVPREDVQVMTELSGIRVRDVMADVGEKVQKGQKLAVLDGQSLANQVIQFRSDYEQVRDGYSRVNRLKDAGAVSQQQVVEKQTDMQAAKAKLDDAELNLRRSIIVAPDAGIIFERKALIGELVSASEPLFRIARHNEVELEAMVPEADLASLKHDQAASVTLTGRSMPIAGTIRLITPRIDNATRMAAVRIRLQNEESIPVGLFARAQIALTEREGIILPQTAIQRDANGEFVWRIGIGNRAERLPVKIMLSQDGIVLVAAIPPATRVVKRAGALISEGDAVNAVGER